jgi:hypothetical protein
VLVLASAQTRTHGHGLSQVQSGRIGSSNGTCFGEDVVSELPFIRRAWMCVDERGIWY